MKIILILIFANGTGLNTEFDSMANCEKAREAVLLSLRENYTPLRPVVFECVKK